MKISGVIILLIALQLSTAFPFAFALVVGSTIKTISAWKLEQGATLGFLEQMIGSQSVGGTVTTQLLLRRINALALILLGVWSLSPLGSQSCLNILSVEDRLVASNITLYHFDTQGAPMFQEGVGAYSVILPSLNAILEASLIAPASIRNSSVDLWGNVKVPDLSRLPRNVSANSLGWLNLSSNSGTITYSSLLGIPVSGLVEGGNTTFTMWTSYITLSCDSADIANASWTGINETWSTPFPVVNVAFGGSGFKNGTAYAQGIVSDTPLTSLNVGGSSNTINSTFTLGTDHFWVGMYGQVEEFINDTRSYPPGNLFFRSVYGEVESLCPMTTIYAESVVKCVGTICSVIAIRPSQLQHPNSNLTNLGFAWAMEDFTQSLIFSSYVPGMTAGNGASSMLEYFIMDPESAIYGGLGLQNEQDASMVMQGLDPDIFASRLQQIINTYWYGSYWPANYINSSTFVSNDLNQPDNVTVQAENVVWEQIYVCNFGWLTVLLLGTIIMLISAVLGIWFGILIRGPDILGYVSSTLRDSSYVMTAGQESTLSGPERSRRYGSMRLKLADVGNESDSGYIALAQDDGAFPGRLSRHRLYK